MLDILLPMLAIAIVVVHVGRSRLHDHGKAELKW